MVRRSPSPRRKAPTSGAKSATTTKNIIEDDPQESSPSSRPYKNDAYFAHAEPKRKKWKNYRQILDMMPGSAQYAAMAAPPSLRPKHRWCDVTGLEGRYRDPGSGLWYHSASVYQFVRQLSPAAVQAYLHVRGAGVNL